MPTSNSSPRFLFTLFAVLLLTLFLLVITWQGLAQAAALAPASDLPAQNDRGPVATGEGVWQGPQDELSESQRQVIQADIKRNIARLTAEGKLPPVTPSVVLFGWPVQPIPELNDYGYHGISNFVDQASSPPGTILDYACGDRTYNTHRGTDIFTWPFPFNRMDANEMMVVAAAPGVIVYKQDGSYDRNCTFNNEPWNAIYVQHSDGSVAWYGHLKRYSLTAKGPGSSVAAGEYLGMVGSSGSSTGPHLHFEVRDAANQIIDPYAGACNSLNGETWWQTQRPYYDSAVNAVTTGDAAFELHPCPAQDEPHLQDNFMPGAPIYFTTFYRDQLANQISTYSLYMPNGELYYSWIGYIEEEHFPASYRWAVFWLVPEAIPGTWRFEVEYEGQTYRTYFNWGDPTYLYVTSPVANDFWRPGTTQTIHWSDNLGGDVRLELWQNGSYLETLAYHTPSDGAYNWNVPTDLPRDTPYTIRAINSINETLSDQSDPFYINYPLTVTSPLPLQVWQPGETYTITWQDELANPMRLELLHSGELSTTLTISTTQSGFFTWTVPLTVSNIIGYQVRVIDLVENGRLATSGFFFLGQPLSTYLPAILKK